MTEDLLTQNIDNTLLEAGLPELGAAYHGKVRENYVLKDRRLILTSDRISAYDRIMPRGIPFKGQVLNQLAVYWFEQTRDIVPNHIISVPDPCVLLVHECAPVPIEVVVRRFLTGSAWRSYQARSVVSGVKLPPGMKADQEFEQPILTPSTKAMTGHDEEISREEILKQQIVDKGLWEQIEDVALKLFARGTEILEQRGVTLVDTKYEFGLHNGTLMLMDEIHTPDSSRFWLAGTKDQDKEYLRRWLREDRQFMGDGPVPELPDEVVLETARRYIGIYERMSGQALNAESFPVRQRVVHNLRRAGLITGCFTAIIMASDKDREHAEKIVRDLQSYNIPVTIRVGSAHKVPEHVLGILREYERSLEPMVYITVAGRSDALSGLVSANTRFPVIGCPPNFNATDVFSTLRMPSFAPAMTVISPDNAALAAAKILGRDAVPARMRDHKAQLTELDAELQS